MDHVVLELTSCISQRLQNARPPEIMSSPHFIYRTPKLLRKVNEAAYTPRLVSIGPYHYENVDLQMMEKVKDIYLRNYLDRTQRTLKDILNCIMEYKEELKRYYAEEVTLSDTSFVEMILLDGVFIIELFLQMLYPDLVQNGNKIFLQQHVPDLINDLFFMLENQLPWFVIEELYNKDVIQLVPEQKPFSGIARLAILICSNRVPSYRRDLDMKHEPAVKHLHDLLRTTIIHPLPPNRFLPLTLKMQRLSATVLHEAGVMFKVRESESFLDIIFDKGALYMPRFIFDGNTETFARNLMAYEQCHYQDTYLCDYFYLMDSLINTSKDVDLLVKSEIIINRFGDNDEVATLVNNLFKHVQIDLNRFCYAELCKDLDGHSEIRWNNWKTTFKRDYLSTPWKVASTIAAIILLSLTLIQTVCSLISVIT